MFDATQSKCKYDLENSYVQSLSQLECTAIQ